MRTSRARVEPSRGGPCGGVRRGRRSPLPPVPLRAEPVESRMIHRECGVLKTTYEADMALYPLPIARWTVAALAVLFLLVLPFSVHEYYLSIVNLVAIAVVGALGLRSEEHTSELQSPCNLVCRLLLEKKKRPSISPATY